MGDPINHHHIMPPSLTWDVADDWSTTLGAVFYESGDTPETAIGDNDRLFLEIRRDF